MRNWTRFLAICASLLMSGCGARTVTVPTTMFPPECELVPSPENAGDTIVVALPDEVDLSHAPWPRNASERTLFRQLYETLIRIDCLDRVQPELAETWKRNRRGTRWTFSIREDAVFWDGTPVTADDVARSWHYATVALGPLDAGIDSVSASDDKILHVYFSPPRRRMPRVFADGGFAVAKPLRKVKWRLGSGPYRVVDASESKTRLGPAEGKDLPSVQFSTVSGRDARDMLDAGADAMLTADPTVIDYASSREQLTVVPLPWDQTYILLSPARAMRVARGENVSGLSTEFCVNLARDAVRAEARAFQPPSWWQGLNSCAPGTSSTPSRTTEEAKILYPARDPVARDLAERLVALSGSDTRKSREAAELKSALPELFDTVMRTASIGVTDTQFARRLRAADARVYIIAVARKPADRCYEARKLLDIAPWLPFSRTELSDALLPLVDTRRHLIVNPARAGISIDGDANVLPVSGRLERR